MRRLVHSIAVLLVLGLDAAHGALIWDNGPTIGISGWTIGGGSGYSMSNSFNVAAPTTLTSVHLQLMTIPGELPQSVNWAIGTSPLSSDLGSGTAALTNSLLGSVSNYDLYDSSFSLSVPVGVGTYWFTLTDMVTDNQNGGYWGISNGPSAGFHSDIGDTTDYIYVGTNSASFQLFDGAPTTVTPEPTSLALAGFAGLGMAAGAWRRRRQQKQQPA